MAIAGISILKSVSSEPIPRLHDVRMDAGVLGFTLFVSIVTTVLCGLAPALETTKHNLNDALKEGAAATTSGLRRSRLRNALVVAEIALSLPLLVGAGLMLNSFANLVNLNRGIQTDHLIVAKLDFSISGYTTWVRPTNTRPQVTILALMERLAEQPGVQSVAAVSSLSRSLEPPRQGIVLERGQPNETPRTNYQGITPDYFRTMGIPLLTGRTFNELDAFEAPTVAIINETIAKRYFADADPIGQHLAMEGRTPGQPAGPNRPNTSAWTEIVGVVADTRKLNLNADTIPEIYVPYWQYPMQTPELHVRTTAPIGSTISAIRNEVRAANKNLPAPSIQTLDAMLSDVVAQPRFQATLLTLFGVIALLLSAVGIYGVMAYTVSQRVHEIGIRMALGAEPKHVFKMIVAQGMQLVLIGIAVGLATALAFSRVLSSLLFSVSATDPLTFTAVVLLLAVVALGACLVPARRAIKVDPMLALRHE